MRAIPKGHGWVHLLMVSMVAVSVSLACERCLAFAASGDTAPVHHSTHHCGSADESACDCPAAEPASAGGWNMLAAAVQSDAGDSAPAALPVSSARAGVRLAGGAWPRQVDIPPPSLLRSFCIQLE